MIRQFLSLLWYAVLTVGTWRAFSIVRDARSRANPIEQAREAARALGAGGVVLWIYCVLDEMQREINWTEQPDVMAWLGLLGTAVIFAIYVLVPTWAPHWLLVGVPGRLRCGTAALVAWVIAAFAGACALGAPLMFLFSDSASEFLGGILTVALPLAVLILIASTVARLARRVHAA